MIFIAVVAATLVLASQNKPLPPAEAAATMTLPEGFRATLFAGEPDVVQPIAFTFDDRGRLWVVECFSYPNWVKEGPGRDRIVIFEDKDGDGRFDSRKVFWDKGSNLSGIQIGFGGVWACSAPNFIFIPDRNGDDVPDGPPVVLLDGWDFLKAKHNVYNGLTWGPDGWLYGCNGIQATSYVGKPGTPEAQRIPLNCGVWRYHPTRHIFEPVAWGTTNPWGLDFDEYGQIFVTNCVIHHLWHMIPGAHFHRMYGQDLNPYVYQLMDSCADHLHWVGGRWQDSRGGKGEHDAPGGGHAHVGAMIYLGDNWPDRYRNGLFTCNLHGLRVNHDTLERRGSGYVARHAPDFLFMKDPWFRGLTIQYGPDGGVFLSDWSDTGECHNYVEVHQSSGRIFKITHGQPRPFTGDLAKLSDAELVRLHTHKNEWHVRHSRRVLHERATQGKLAAETIPSLRRMLAEKTETTQRLRSLWTLHCLGDTDENLLAGLLGDSDAYVRGWAIQLALDHRQPSPGLVSRFAALATNDPSPVVRRFLASASQRLPMGKRWSIAEALLAHAEDSTDQNLPLLYWYGVEPLVADNATRFGGLVARAKIGIVREHVARRAVEAQSANLNSLVGVLGEVADLAAQGDILRGIHAGLLGRRTVPMPQSWPVAFKKLAQSPNADVREQSLLLGVVFDEPQALAVMRQRIADARAAPEARRNALDSLVFKKDAELVPVLFGLLGDRQLRGPALRGLATFADPATPEQILKHFTTYSESEKADAIQTLASRPAYARVLLAAIENNKVARRDLNAFTVRQMVSLKDSQVNELLNRVWGTIRPASQERAALTEKYKKLLTPEYLKQANRSQGRAVYAKNCASCHVLFGEGIQIGPELTGSQRVNLDYVLENLLDPSAVVGRDYQVSIVQTKDGRLVTGIIKQETEKALTVQTQNEAVVIPKGEIESRTVSPLSMMPEGMLAALTNEQVRDLIAYLASPKQAPLPR